MAGLALGKLPSFQKPDLLKSVVDQLKPLLPKGDVASSWAEIQPESQLAIDINVGITRNFNFHSHLCGADGCRKCAADSDTGEAKGVCGSLGHWDEHTSNRESSIE